MRAELARLTDAWASLWPEALALWSKFTKLSDPRWCYDDADTKREGLSGSFAMIRLQDHAVVISLAQVHALGLDTFPLEILGHEIGHHVLCPGDLADQARLIARLRRGLPTKEDKAPLLANLYADLLINDRLERQSSLHMDEVYRLLAGGSSDTMWTFTMRLCEILWNRPKGSLARGTITKQIDGDAALGARVIRVYAKDWLKGAGRFAALCFPYLEENGGDGVRRALKGWIDVAGTPAGEAPDGLTEIDDDELDGAIHPAFDPEITGLEESEADAGQGNEKQGDTVARQRYREPFEYRDILKSVGVTLSDEELTVRYYRERAIPHLVRFPVRPLPESREPLPEGLDPWDAAESIEKLDLVESMLGSPTIIPGVTTVQRLYGESPGALPEREPLDVYLGVDCSGSMINPALAISYPVLAGTIIAVSALRAGARVMVCLSGEPGRFAATDGFVADEKQILTVLTGYLGTGYSFGIHRLRATFEKRDRRSRPVHIMIVTDHDIFAMLGEKNAGRDGWTVAREALAAARGGGTYVLHMPPEWTRDGSGRIRAEGWNVAHVVAWEDIVAFAREFSRRHYETAPSAARP